MTGQMCWLASFATKGEKILHLRLQPHDPWQPYTAFASYRVPDYDIPRGSRGWATCQRLLQAGWDIIPSDRARAIPALATTAGNKAQS